MQSVISIRNLKKRYTSFQLSINNLEVPYGKVVGLIGENGAGKSTLINLILNQLTADEGSISVLGLNNLKNELDIKKQLSVLLEENHLPENFDIREIEKMMKLIYSNWDSSSFNSFIDLFDLPENKILRKFSRGMKVKLNFAVALSHRPRLLIADEATSGLDPIVRRELFSVISDHVQKENLTVVISTHIMSDLEQVSDFLVFMHDGDIVLTGSSKDLMSRFSITDCKKKIGDDGAITYKMNSNGTVRYLVDHKMLEKERDAQRASLEEILLFLVKGERCSCAD